MPLRANESRPVTVDWLVAAADRDTRAESVAVTAVEDETVEDRPAPTVRSQVTAVEDETVDWHGTNTLMVAVVVEDDATVHTRRTAAVRLAVTAVEDETAADSCFGGMPIDAETVEDDEIVADRAAAQATVPVTVVVDATVETSGQEADRTAVTVVVDVTVEASADEHATVPATVKVDVTVETSAAEQAAVPVTVEVDATVETSAAEHATVPETVEDDVTVEARGHDADSVPLTVEVEETVLLRALVVPAAAVSDSRRSHHTPSPSGLVYRVESVPLEAQQAVHLSRQRLDLGGVLGSGRGGQGEELPVLIDGGVQPLSDDGAVVVRARRKHATGIAAAALGPGVCGNLNHGLGRPVNHVIGRWGFDHRDHTIVRRHDGKAGRPRRRRNQD